MKIPYNKRPLSKLASCVDKLENESSVYAAKALLKKKHWSPKDLRQAYALIKENKNHFPNQDNKEYFLYAIYSHPYIKLGFSSEIGKRMASLQTGNAETLELLWQCYAGDTRHDAEKQEDHLHELCVKYHVRGEWYGPACLDTVKSFKPLLTAAEMEELSLVVSSNNKIGNLYALQSL